MSHALLSDVYSDELISATDLNRQPGQVLDRALEGPVTITRGGEYFALLRRKTVADCVKTANSSKLILDVLFATLPLLCNNKVELENPYSWLNAFDADDLHEFIQEILSAYRSSDNSDEALDEVKAIIHEWHESAIAIGSADLAEAFNDDSDSGEIPLTSPECESPN